MHAIYQILNKNTKDIYIGSAVSFDDRRWVHLCDLRKGKHHSHILQNSFNKHGEEAFEFSVIEEVEDKQMLIQREQHYMDTLKPRYNISKTAGSPLGTIHTAQSRLNMSLAQKGRSLVDKGHTEQCKCCICFRLKKEESPNYIQRERRACSCRCGDTFVCMVNSSKRYVSGHNRNLPPCKPVVQYTNDLVFVKEWESVKEAASALKVNEGRISSCCKEKIKSVGGFIWKYKY